MPIRSTETPISEITGEDNGQRLESKHSRKQLADLSSDLAEGYRRLINLWSLNNKSTRYYDEPATFLTELIMFAENKTADRASDFLEGVFRQSGLKDEQKAILRELIRTQIDIIDDYIQALFSEKEQGPTKTEAFKLEQSIFNQKLAIYFYLANTKKSSSYEAATLLSSLAQAIGELRLPESDILLNILNGARAQAAICRTLTSAGYEVILPDFNNSEEMKSWDLNGVDFVAISPIRKIILIDAKGKRIDQTDEHIQISAEVTAEKKGISAEHQRVIDQVLTLDRQSTNTSSQLELRAAEAIRLEVTVPTADIFMSRIGELDRSTQRTLLRRVEPY
jgi:hypothetical protein